MNADLHCHTTASDGTLKPAELVARAIEKGVELLAITDHDNFDNYQEAKEAAGDRIRLVTGIEFSAVWQGITIHIVGLNFDPALLQGAVQRQKASREERTLKIAQRLEKKGVKNALEGARRFASDDAAVGRPHFAKYLVAEGHFESEAEAFRKWLGAGKAGDVKTSWPDIQTVVADITRAGGHAVLAHPQHYKMTNRKLGKLLTDFKACGGEGIEVCVSGLNAETIDYFASLCEKFELMASRGSDFHSPTNQWVELGRVAPLPESVTPIWQAFQVESAAH
ncbi:PHP domain-containing protein [Proteobacteria bacterium 005FR1]|nr:PHP domain-containing protein [Proteobacteria bacterium 005FR1]